MTKEIDNFSKYYASDDGYIYEKETGHRVAIRIHHKCPEVMLKNDEGKVCHCVPSRIILKAFRDISESEDLVVHHLDHNQFNNNPSNLVWVTRKQHGYIHKLMRDQEQPTLFDV